MKWLYKFLFKHLTTTTKAKMTDLKQCKICKETLEKSMFNVNNRNKDKLETWCKTCNKQKYLKKREYHLMYNKLWREQHPDYQKKWRTNNNEYKIYKQEYYKTHKGDLNKKTQERRKKYPQKWAASRKKYIETHKEHVNEYHRKWKQNKRETDPQYSLKLNMSRRIRIELNNYLNMKKSKTTCEYLGCDITFLKTYLESKFDLGMSWKSYGKLWHIDHIIPCKAWDQTNKFETYCCWNYRNLQPMYACENHSKRDKYDKSKKMMYIERMKALII